MRRHIDRMKEKEIRLGYIRKILNDKNICSQEQLLQELINVGHGSTQATLSRDLHHLRAIRITTQFGHVRYILPNNPNYTHAAKKSATSNVPLEECLLNCEPGGELMILHTIPGFSAALAGNIDNKHFPHIAGTLAGDDTVMVVGKKNSTHQEMLEDLKEILPHIERNL